VSKGKFLGRKFDTTIDRQPLITVFPVQRRMRPRGSGGQEQKARMPVIKVKDNESFEQAMKRFKKTCEKAGILTELRRREYYDKPSISKKKKEAAARKRALKKIRRMTH
jgi:small subunit ribosomal protein S21